ncbi:sensor histidine kinase [Actinophytocola oryzae]|uniref:histidine kinase n=1 Tax=Actinophytocola oryzae TaxID=502181 RepID=A0A4R7VUQ9_9PSEU|nr:histidine kinase [Actinophytocola oryzae]TDV53572.1 signal transduction histidine kinase [Actinophytocola oryzae]
MGRRVLGVVTTVIAVAACVLSSIYVVGNDKLRSVDDPIDPSAFAWLSFVAAVGAAVLLVWRHRWPVLVCGLTLIPSLLLAADALAALVALAALAAARRDRMLWLGGFLVYAATSLAVWRDAGWHESVTIMGTWIADSGPGKVIGTVVTAAVLTAVPLAVGILRGTRADLRERERTEALLRDEMSRQEERSRIAHEMHDVLGHRLSLLSLQAGALEVTAPETAGDVARTVRSTARQSLEDLRQVIGVLRDGRDFHLQGPVPTLADLPTLVGQTRQAGVPVNLTVMLDMAQTAPAPLAMAVYRIVQESLTNIVRHAPGAPAEVVVRGGPGVGVALEVVNGLRQHPAPPSPGSGSGLTGISERVTALGGRVNIGPTTNGTFAVQAWLPWPPG